jgi:hypothetical protein
MRLPARPGRAPAFRGGARQHACRGAGLEGRGAGGQGGLGLWARAGKAVGGGAAKRRAAPEKRPRAIGTDLEHMRPASPLVASLGGLNAVSLIPLPFLACNMQSPGNRKRRAAPEKATATWSYQPKPRVIVAHI